MGTRCFGFGVDRATPRCLLPSLLGPERLGFTKNDTGGPEQDVKLLRRARRARAWRNVAPGATSATAIAFGPERDRKLL